jgi:hypothetical protein
MGLTKTVLALGSAIGSRVSGGEHLNAGERFGPNDHTVERESKAGSLSHLLPALGLITFSAARCFWHRAQAASCAAAARME